MAINNRVNITLTSKDEASKWFDKVWKSASWLWGKLSKLWWPLKAIWVWAAAAWAAIWVTWVKLFNVADTLETTIWKSKIVFGEYFDDIDKFAKETWKSMWLSRWELLKTASWIQDLLIPMWFTREEATKNTKELISLSWALSEWSAWQYDAVQVWDILAKAMLWEREQLKSLWISISENDVQQRLLKNWTNELTWAALQQARAVATQQLIFEKSTDAQAAYADGADSLTRKKAEMTATLWNLKETIAGSLLPAFHEIVLTLQPVIEKVAENIKLWFENKDNIDKVVTSVKAAITFFKKLAFVLWLIVDWFVIFWEALWVAAFKIVEFSEKSAEKFVEFWEKVWIVFNDIKDGTVATFNEIKDIVKGIIDSIVKYFTNAFIKVQKIMNKIKSIWSSITWAVSWAVWSVKDAISWARANWWPVTMWKSYLVWEKWPEIFTPNTSWNITPNSQSMWWVTINMWWVTVQNEADENRLVQKIEKALTNKAKLYNIWIS